MSHFLDKERGRQWGVWKPSQKEIIKQLGSMPPVFKEQRFTREGLIQGEHGLLVPAYVASPLGFNKWGRVVLDTMLHPRLIEAGVFPLDPFLNCAPFLPEGAFNEDQSVRDYRKKWDRFDKKVIDWVNYGALMPASGLLVAVLDGPYVDEGVAGEMGIYTGKFGPIIGIRTDFRAGENIAYGINPALLPFMDNRKFGGAYFEGPNADEQAYEWIGRYAQEVIAS